MEVSRSAVAAMAAANPELMDMVEEGKLVLVDKKMFGPVLEWRRELVETEATWVVVTSHVSRKLAADVDRVVRAVSSDNVVVELCKSRAGIMHASKGAEDDQLLR